MNPCMFKAFHSSDRRLSTICLQTPLVYKTLEDPRSLLLHILCVMGIEILRDGRVRMTEAGGNVNRLRAGFDQPRRVRMAKAVSVQTQAMERIAHVLMCIGNPRRMNAEQRAAFRFDCGGQSFWQENEQTIRVLALIGDLIRTV